MKRCSRWGLVLTYAGLIVVFAAVLLLSSTLTSRNALTGHARNIMENIASYTIDKSSHYLTPARDAARLTLGLSRNNILSAGDAEAMEAYFYEQLFIYPQFSGIYYGTVNGDFIMASRYNARVAGGFFTKIISNRQGTRGVELIYRGADFRVSHRETDPEDPYDPRQRPWFRQAEEKGQLVWTAPYVFFTSQKPGITTANPVYDENGTLTGVIGVDIALDELSTFLSRLKVGQHGLAFIMNESGDLVAYPDVSKLRQPEGEKFRLSTIGELDDPIARTAFLSLGERAASLSGSGPTFTSFDHEGERFNAMFAPFSDPQWPWTIGIYLPENDYLGALKQNALLNVGVSVVAVLLAGLLGLAISRRLDRARVAAEVADQAKSRFLARMSHDIRTPMNALLGANELLAETELTDEQRQYLKLSRSAGSVLHDLVSDVLDMAKIESGELSPAALPFRLREILEETCSVFALGAQEKGLVFHCSVNPDVPDALIGDPALLKQVLVNLIGNALKFTEQGSISLEVSRLEPDGRGQGETLAFTVRDTGPGIPKDQHEAVFEHFTRLPNPGCKEQGTGLGLSICRLLVQALSGRIELASEPGKGSAFRVLLPFERAEPGDEALERPQDAEETRLRSLRVLLVDDDEANRLIMELFLRGQDVRMKVAENGQEAVRACSEQDFDLVIMDLEMPVMDGFTATRRIRAVEAGRNTPPVPIVALTAHASLDTAEEALRAGCTEHLPKPIRKDSLLALLRRYAKV
jgi:signal transduction histidine kinase/ActR/RegA family two-component response regulator